ncbi:MAG: YfiR family protein [Deltaproteobacteria bacterium]|nr:YfiR family protein [Deltaproteobacteria bacterium]
MPLSWLIRVFLVALLVHVPAPILAEEPLAQVQAAYFFNFLKFATWPATADPTTLHVRILRDKKIHDALLDAAGTSIHGKNLDIRLGVTPDDLTGANAVFISKDSAPDIPPPTWKQLGSTMLVVSDWDRALDHGATIQLQTMGGKLRFAVNLNSARQSGLEISSRLLRLASEVRGE